MKRTKILSAVFGLLGILLLTAAVALSFFSRKTPVRLLALSADAEQCAADYMDALCRGDFETVGTMTAGHPQYHAGSEMESPLAQLLWDAYTDSLSCTFAGSCYASDSGLCRDAEMDMLDIPGVLGVLKNRSQALLEQRAAVTDQDLVFDENGQYREEFAMDVLFDGAASILEENPPRKCRTLTLELTFQDNQWHILPNPVVTDILTGSMGG